MRWFVEVSRVGDNAPAERYCLEAKAWQAALQETRKLRGDTGPLSKFSIELLDDGYRAVDPVQKIRYLVNQAPSESPIVMPPAMNGAAHALASPVGGGLASVVAAPAPVAQVAHVPVAQVAPVAEIAVAPAAASVPPVVGIAASGAVSSPAVVSVAPAASSPPAASVKPSVAPKPSVKSTSPSAPRPSPRRSSPKNTAKVQSTPSSAPDAGESSASASGPVAAVVVSTAPSGPSASVAPVAAAPAVAVVAAPSLVVAPSATVAVVAAQVPAIVGAPMVDIASSAPAVAPSPVVAPVAAPSPAPAPAAATEPAKPPPPPPIEVPPYELVVSRTQEPTPEAPITYRELALAVAPGLGRDAIESLLFERLIAMKAELAARPAGKLVQIAIFDHRFEQRPNGPPLGTLAWKDWRGDPVVGFPAFGDAGPPVTNSLPPAPEAAPSPVEVPASPPVAPVEPAAAAAPAPAPTEVAPAPTAPVGVAASDEAEPVPLRKPLGSDPDRASKPKFGRRRRAGEDLISELFDVMHELTFARDIAVGADFVLNVLNDVIPCEAVLIQVFDINTRNFVVVRGRGAGAQRAVLTRTADSDPLIQEIMRRERARVYKVQGDARFSGGRWQHVTSQKREVMAGAVRQGGRYLGMIELCNPIGEAPFHDSEVNALDYICEQFADFVASRPIVLDPDVILGR